MKPSRRWTAQEANVAFALFEELRENEKNITLSEVSLQVKALLDMIKEPDSPALSYRQIYNKFLVEAKKAFPKSKHLVTELFKRGLFASFPQAKCLQMRSDLQVARRRLKGRAKSNQTGELYIKGEDELSISFQSSTNLSQASTRLTIAASRNEAQANAHVGSRQTFEGPNHTHDPSSTEAAPKPTRHKTLSNERREKKCLQEMNPTSSKNLTGRKTRQSHPRVDPPTSDNNDYTRRTDITVEISTSTIDAAAATSSPRDPIASFGHHADFRQRFEEEIGLFATSLVHRERKHVPPHQEAVQAMTKIDSSCEKAISHFVLAQSFGYVTAQDLTDDTNELCRLLVGGNRREEIREALEILSAHDFVSPKIFLRGCAAAAVMQWVYLDIKPQLPSVCQYPLWDVLRSALAATPNIHRRLIDAMTLDYLERHFEITIPALSKELTKRLHVILMNFKVSKPTSAESDRPESLTARSDHLENFRLWERNMSDAFEEALRLRLKHLCSPLKYNYTFPASGQQLAGDKMVSLCSESSAYLGQVWLCLSPLIESWNESMDSSSHVIVTPARVVPL